MVPPTLPNNDSGPSTVGSTWIHLYSPILLLINYYCVSCYHITNTNIISYYPITTLLFFGDLKTLPTRVRRCGHPSKYIHRSSDLVVPNLAMETQVVICWITIAMVGIKTTLWFLYDVVDSNPIVSPWKHPPWKASMVDLRHQRTGDSMSGRGHQLQRPSKCIGEGQSVASSLVALSLHGESST